VLQIEDLLIYENEDLWTHQTFSSRWTQLNAFWNRLPADQPLLAVKPQIVEPISIADWDSHYDSSLSWILQPEGARNQRFYWWDSITPKKETTYVAPTMKRATTVQVQICALAKPSGLPDAYTLEASDGKPIGIAAVSTMALSQELRSSASSKVEVAWNEEFNKYQITKILPSEIPVSGPSFFRTPK